MERALARVHAPRFAAVAEFPGVVRGLAGLFDIAPGAKLPDDVGRLFADVARQLASKGMAPRHARLAAARESIRSGAALPPKIVIDGFFKLAAGELALFAGLAQRTDLTITLPDWPGSEAAREALREFDHVRLPAAPEGARTTFVTAANMERESEEIARRILHEAARGRPFRDIGIVLRARDPYGPLIETTLARFGIPARAYFVDALASHPAIQFRMEMIRSALTGWEHEPLLRALRMPASGLGATVEGDSLDFEMRKRLPSRGWSRPLIGDCVIAFKRTREWVPDLAVEDHADPARVRAWRSTAAALHGFDEAVDAAALAFGGQARVTLAEFWKQLERVLAQHPLRVPDARRNVVHILDAYEARQWSLPLVFMPGLTERHFPQYHHEDPIVGDAALRRAGLDTKADREHEESFLFALATTRATEETVLSYPRFDEAGQSSLPSFFLPDTQPQSVETRVRPAPSRTIVFAPYAPILDERFAARSSKLSASAIDSYVQCPFQFLMKKALRLVERPKAPRDRLNVLLQGSIIHRAFAEWSDKPLLGTALLEEAFDLMCAEERVPQTYRTEAVRLELLRHFEDFLKDHTIDLGWSSRVEESFEFEWQPGLTLRGRLDRVDVSPSGQALVIDYKYSAGERMKGRIEESESGNQVQAGVYLLAVERALGLQPAGMLYCHVKKGVTWDGWQANIPGLDVGEKRTEAGVAEIARAAEDTLLRVHADIVAGRVTVDPREDKPCSWCECRDVCRKETIGRVKTAVGA